MRLLLLHRSFSPYSLTQSARYALRTTFTIPRRFHPAYSLLGRWMRQWLDDERRAEALFIIVLSLLALALLLAQYLAWALLQPAIEAAPEGSTAIAFWIGQVGAVVLVVGFCVIGFEPAITVTADEHALHLQQKGTTLALPYDAIEAVDTITALRYHRHWRCYAATHDFVNRPDGDLLLLRTDEGPVVLGLAPDDREALLDHLDARRSPSFALQTASAA
ncbi:MAG: hypothetical protein GVY18_17210 [Bacteroidetes bacterium]|nr:hypothetical protein [Bacteroidota bacterium]